MLSNLRMIFYVYKITDFFCPVGVFVMLQHNSLCTLTCILKDAGVLYMDAGYMDAVARDFWVVAR